MFHEKRNIIIFGIVLIVLVGAYGAMNFISSPVPRTDDMKAVDVYFVNSAGNKLEPETRYIEAGEITDEVTSVLVELIAGPVGSNLKRTMPGYRGGSNEYNFLQAIKTATRSETDASCVVEIFLSEEYYSMTTADEILLRGSLVYSFTELDYVEGVKIYAGDEEIKRPNGELIGTMNRENVFVNTILNTEKVYQTITLYFPDEGMNYLVKEERKVEIVNRTMESAIVEELLKGPETPGLVSAISADTQINDVTIFGRICYVDLSSAFASKLPAEPEAASLVIYSIVNSITEISGTNVNGVQFYIDARVDEGSGGRIDLSQPFERNEEVIGE